MLMNILNKIGSFLIYVVNPYQDALHFVEVKGGCIISSTILASWWPHFFQKNLMGMISFMISRVVGTFKFKKWRGGVEWSFYLLRFQFDMKVGYVMGYQSVGIQFVCSVFQNLMHKLPGTNFIFFLGWKFSICQPLTLFHYFSHFSEIYWTLIYC